VYIGKTPTVGNFQVCDAISVVNGQAAYTLQVGGVNVAPESANHMLVSLNGILQKPGSSFTISGSTMTFASNLATGDVIDFVQILGNVLDIGQPSDDTVTAAKLNNDIISGQTALTSAPDDTDELLISDAGTIKRIDVSLIGGKNEPSFFVTNGSAQSIANATLTKIEYPTEVFDTDNAFASHKFTVPSGKAGKYLFSGGFKMGTTTDATEVRAVIYKNGSGLYNTNNENTHFQSAIVTAVLDLSATDYIEIYGYHSCGDTFSTIADSNSNYFMGFKLI